MLHTALPLTFSKPRCKARSSSSLLLPAMLTSPDPREHRCAWRYIPCNELRQGSCSKKKGDWLADPTVSSWFASPISKNESDIIALTYLSGAASEAELCCILQFGTAALTGQGWGMLKSLCQCKRKVRVWLGEPELHCLPYLPSLANVNTIIFFKVLGTKQSESDHSLYKKEHCPAWESLETCSCFKIQGFSILRSRYWHKVACQDQTVSTEFIQ